MTIDDAHPDVRSPALSRRTVATSLAGLGALAALGIRPAAAETPAVRNIVLLHGLFADGSCWSEVIPLLQARASKSPRCRTP
jgi:hypothetical protein